MAILQRLAGAATTLDVADASVPQRHVVVVAPPWYPVPPQGYGGIELVVGLLCEALRRAGQRVTLIGADGSEPNAIGLAPKSWRIDLGRPTERMRELTYAARVAVALSTMHDIDVIHDHCGFSTLIAASLGGNVPVVHTVHGDIPEEYATFYSAMSSSAHFVSISWAQRSSMAHLPWIGTVHNAVDVEGLRVAAADADAYLLCLARICPDKGQHVAIEVARRAGMRLVLAGKVEDIPEARDYFTRHVAPHVDGSSIVHIPNVSGDAKARLLSGAHALLSPVQWEEPFGLAIVEAMASGTPVIAMARGAVAELVTNGVSGFLVSDADSMTEAVSLVDQIDPWACARAARTRFSPSVMAREYLALYETAIGKRRAAATLTPEPAAGSVLTRALA